MEQSQALPGDQDIIAALRRGDEGAVKSFSDQFRPLLEAYARKTKIPRWEWSTCVVDLLTDEALRLCNERVPAPRNIAAYLVRAVRHRYLYLKRSAFYREKRHVAASEDCAGEWVVSSACSEDALRASAGPDAAPSSMSDALARLARELDADLTPDERFMLAWVSEGVPRPMIAKWLGMKPDACTKRIWRLCHRLRLEAARRSAGYAGRERQDIDRFLRRASGIH